MPAREAVTDRERRERGAGADRGGGLGKVQAQPAAARVRAGELA